MRKEGQKRYWMKSGPEIEAESSTGWKDDVFFSGTGGQFENVRVEIETLLSSSILGRLSG